MSMIMFLLKSRSFALGVTLLLNAILFTSRFSAIPLLTFSTGTLVFLIFLWAIYMATFVFLWLKSRKVRNNPDLIDVKKWAEDIMAHAEARSKFTDTMGLYRYHERDSEQYMQELRDTMLAAKDLAYQAKALVERGESIAKNYKNKGWDIEDSIDKMSHSIKRAYISLKEYSESMQSRLQRV